MTGSSQIDGLQISAAFDRTLIVLDEKLIEMLREVGPKIKRSSKYAQIAASIREIGVIEPPVVVRHPNNPGRYLLLDGRLRLDILRSQGTAEVTCLLAIDDEAFTYNKRISRLAAVQEHRMILKLIERNVPAERIARSLNIDVSTLQGKARMLNGVCPEAIEILSDKVIAAKIFGVLRCMRPLRQIQAAELMVAMNRYTEGYVRALLAATPRALVAVEVKPKGEKYLTDEQRTLMERESVQLDREVKIAHKSYGLDHLLLVVARGYLVRILENERIFRYLDQHRPEFLVEFRRIAENEAFAA